MTAAVVEMARLVRLSAAPAIPGEKVPHAIARAAHRLGFTRGRTKSFWYKEALSVEPEELEAAREQAIRRGRDAELLRHEYRRALDILARLEAGLTAIDPDFHSETISAVKHYTRIATGSRDSGDPQ